MNIIAYQRIYKQNLNQKQHPDCKKEQPRTKTALDKKEVKSTWAAKACVVLLLIKININNHKSGCKTLRYQLVNALRPEL